MELYQQREQTLGDELERLTAAVDEKLEGFEERERQLEAELDNALHSNAELQTQLDTVRAQLDAIPEPASTRVTRLHQHATGTGPPSPHDSLPHESPQAHEG